MAARKHYPAPPCPRCGHETTLVKGTRYTDDREIIRWRQCPDCGHNAWTRQLEEEILDPVDWAITIPTRDSLSKITITRLT